MWWRKRMIEGLDQDIRDHIERETQDNIERGMTSEDARHAAMRKFGNVTLVKEEVTAVWSFVWFEQLLQDVRYGARMLRKSPGFTLVAVLTLALGIGANTAVFSMVNALLLHPYDFRDLDRIMRVWEDRGADEGIDTRRIAAADAEDVRNVPQLFEGLTTFRSLELNLNDSTGVQSVRGCGVSANFFDVLGVAPDKGRTFSIGEQQPGADQIVIISHGFWQRRLGGDPEVLGKVLQLNGRRYSVVGLMPSSFDYPVPVELWVPLVLSPADSANREKLSLEALARLNPGVTLAQARSQLASLSQRLQREYPRTNSNRRATLLPLRQELYVFTLPLFILLQAAAAFVLFLACANLTNFLFARIFERQQEIAVRTALGAGRGRLTRLFVTETLLLSCLGGAVAILTSFWSVSLLRTSIAPSWTMWVPGWNGIQLDKSVLAATLAVTAVVGILFGLGTVLYVGKSDPFTTLKQTGRNLMLGGRAKFRSALVVVQVMFALVLLVCAGLTTDGFLRLANVYRGFQPASVLRMEISLPQQAYAADSQITAFYQRLLTQTAALPGVSASALITNSPASNVDNETTLFTIEGRAALKPSETHSADLQISTSDYFRELRIPLLAGRDFSEADKLDAAPVAIISRSMARQFWPGEDALGQRIKFGAADSSQPWTTIVGVVEDVRQNWWNPTARPAVYRPFPQSPRRSMVLLIRADSNPASYTASVRSAVQGIDAQIALATSNTLETEITDSIAIIRIMGALMAIFGCVALALASIGVYGVLAESVARRVPEIGIRLALGALPHDVTTLVLGQALRLTAIGLAIGVPLSFVVNRAMSSLIFGIVSVNPAILIGFTLLLVFVALAAAYIPARRAMRIDPMAALRHQ